LKSDAGLLVLLPKLKVDIAKHLGVIQGGNKISHEGHVKRPSFDGDGGFLLDQAG
jgi:hypothetical protein